MSPTVLEQASFIVHPGFTAQGETDEDALRSSKKLLDAYGDFVSAVDETRHAVFALAYWNEVGMNMWAQSTNPGDALIGASVKALQERHSHLLAIYFTVALDPTSCARYYRQAQALLGPRGQTMDETTQLHVLGETSSVCVPEVASGLALAQKGRPPKVDLALTNARQWKERFDGCREGGDVIRKLQEKFPGIEFIAVPPNCVSFEEEAPA